MKICLGKEIENVKKKDSESEKKLLKNRDSNDINELDADDVYFHSRTIKNIKIGSNTVNRIYLNNSIVYELQDTIIATKFHSLVPSATATNIIFDVIENKDISGYNLVGYCDANNNIAVFNNNTEYLVLNMRNAVNYAPADCSSFFSWYTNLISCIFNNFNTVNVINMLSMFYFCSHLVSLDVTNFNTENVILMAGMFGFCSSLKSLDVRNFCTGNVTNMNAMFFSCSNLVSLDVSNFNTENVIDMHQLFSFCRSLQSIDISNFNTSKTTDMDELFAYSNRLKTIISNTFSKLSLTSSADMFKNCSSLVGGNGTKYNSSHIDAVYARIDGENGLPGYFTAPTA